jgi:YD repeat-containing protein
MPQVSQSGSAVTGKEASFTYNGDGQITGMTMNAAGSPVATASYGYTYDANNWITQLTDNDGTTSYTYNDDGELTGASGTGLPSRWTKRSGATVQWEAIPGCGGSSKYLDCSRPFARAAARLDGGRTRKRRRN